MRQTNVYDKPFSTLCVTLYFVLLITALQIVLYKLYDDPDNIKYKSSLMKQIPTALEGFIPVAGLIREEIKGRTLAPKICI